MSLLLLPPCGPPVPVSHSAPLKITFLLLSADFAVGDLLRGGTAAVAISYRRKTAVRLTLYHKRYAARLNRAYPVAFGGLNLLSRSVLLDDAARG